MEDCTVVKVDSVNKQGLLLEVVQVMTDLNLFISKSYISSDAEWFMDGRVFCGFACILFTTFCWVLSSLVEEQLVCALILQFFMYKMSKARNSEIKMLLTVSSR
jgi:hypothetical protein